MKLAGSQSVPDSWPRVGWRAARSFLHRRYIRAIVTGLSLAVIASSVGALALALRHDVSTMAVVRYFARPQSEEADLGRYFQSASTAIRLEPFLLLNPGINSGGLVYVEEHGLVFYPHAPREHRRLRKAKRVKDDLFRQLTPLYWKADLEALIGELNRPRVRRQLIDAGASVQDLYTLQHYQGASLDPRGRTQLLRVAARQLQFFAPYIPEPYHLSFADQLRFYDANGPDGSYVGMWEIAAPGLFASIDEAYAREMSEHSHYVVLSRIGPEETLVSDFYRGERRNYVIQPFGHPSGHTFYRVTAQPAS